MTITRDEEFPAEIANLFQAFNRCADGHATGVVLEAAANFLIAAISNHVSSSGQGQDTAVKLASQISISLPEHVRMQWKRQTSPDDVVVPMAGD